MDNISVHLLEYLQRDCKFKFNFYVQELDIICCLNKQNYLSTYAFYFSLLYQTNICLTSASKSVRSSYERTS